MSQTIPVMIEGETRDVPVGISVAAALSLTANPTTRVAVGGQPRPFAAWVFARVPGDRQRTAGAGLPDAVPARNDD